MPTFRRHDGRRANELRPTRIEPGYVRSADGSCLIEAGRTRVICTASVVTGVEKWRAGRGLGWVTAEYGMLPASGGHRKPRPIARPDGRSVEIQRLIGRALRSVVRFEAMGENTIYMDCDVLEADGGTRTAAVNGAYVAMAMAIRRSASNGRFRPGALNGQVAAISVGLVAGRALLDLDYEEDSSADADMNLAMTAAGKYVEVQGTAERGDFGADALLKMLALGRGGIRKILLVQREALGRAEK
jgi:ribonuclease PH